MKIKNIDEWAKEIIYLATLDVHSNEEEEQFSELIDMTDNGIDNKKVVKTLMMIPYINDDLGGQIETILNNLGEVDYKLYYEVLFELMPFRDNNSMHWALYMLEKYSGDIYTEKEWEEIYNISWKRLDQDTLEQILKYYEKDGSHCNYDDYPFPEFKHLFIKLLKNKYIKE